MRTLLLPLVMLIFSLPACASTAMQAASSFDTDFTGRTLRFDYHHAGTQKEEHIAYFDLRLEGEWPGSRTQLVDDTNLGKYLFEVREAKSGRLMYSRGFCSIYGEWETTGEAKAGWRAFEESRRFPEPRMPVKLTLSKRDSSEPWHEFYSSEIDPQSRFVDRSAIPVRGEVIPIFESAPSSRAVDLLVVADGYKQDHRDKFVADVKRLVAVMFDTEPYRARKTLFNVRALFVPSNDEGISNPRKEIWKSSALGLSFNAFDSDRYVLTYQDRNLRELAAQAPYDALILLFDERKYGGGGIYDLWATCAADTEPAPYVFVHEFGHSFAGLADEYYTSQVSYEDLTPAGSEPWEPNTTALLDPKHLKWGDLIDKATPVPTPWRQVEFDAADVAYQKKRKELIDAKASEEASEALMRAVKKTSSAFLASEHWFGKLGAFEGSMYQAKGLYRPELDCIMFTRNPTRFCGVCERAIIRVIERCAR